MDDGTAWSLVPNPTTATITCLGEIMLESSAFVDALPDVDTTVVVDDVRRRLGGPAINMALHLTSLGERVRLAGVMGRWDEAALRELAVRARLDASHIAWIEGSSDVLFYFKTDAHYSGIYQRAPLPADLAEYYAQLSASTDILLLAGSRHVSIRRIFADIAKRSSARWKVFAPNYAVYLYTGDELASILPHADLVSFNEAEAQAVVSKLGLESIGSLRRLTRAAILVTRSSLGASLIHEAIELDLPALSGRAGDVIGAGDAFVSGMVHGLSQGRSLADAADLGAHAAATFVKADSPVLLGECGEFVQAATR